METLRMTSPDLTDVRIERIAGLFPNVVTESIDSDGNRQRSINFDLLQQELSDHIVEGPQERYQLDWPGKRAAAFAANAPIAKTLRPERELSVDFDSTGNIFIEGDNLDALKLLQESYLGKIKLIYIDPPYNTGNDFVYADRFAATSREELQRSGQVDEEGIQLVANPISNGRFHSDWLSMIYPRLKLARNLLTDDGFIFVSIDDNEVHNLRALMGEIFGDQNFVGLVTRATGTPTGGGFDGLTNMVDYLVAFRRSESATLNGLEFGESDAAIYNEEDERGKYLTRSIRRTGGEDRREDRPSMYFGVEAPDGTLVYPIGPGGYESRWICGRDKFNEMTRDGLIEWKKTRSTGEEQWHPYQKFYLEGRKKRPSNLWTDLEGNKKGTRELRGLFDSEKVFDSPKPSALVERIIEIASDSDSLVLDFFAGSATTAESVMRLNSRTGANRNFLLVQLAEATPDESAAARAGYSTIADISRERIRRSGKAIAESAGVGAATLDTGFRSLRIDSTNLTDVLRGPDETHQLDLDQLEGSVKAGRTTEDLFFQVLLDWGLELSMPVSVEVIEGHEVLVLEDDALIACFDENINLDAIRTIAKREPIRAVFRDIGFASDAARINAEQIFRELAPATDVKAI